MLPALSPVALETSIYVLSLESTILALTLYLSTFNLDTLGEMFESWTQEGLLLLEYQFSPKSDQ